MSKLITWGWEKKKRTLLRYIKIGDIFCFKYDDYTYYFGCVIAMKPKDYTIVEIFNYTSSLPVISKEIIDNAIRIFHPINLDAYSLFDRKVEGEWRIIGHYEGYAIKDEDNISFAVGVVFPRKMDINGNLTKISPEEAEGLQDFAYLGDTNVKNLIESSIRAV